MKTLSPTFAAHPPQYFPGCHFFYKVAHVGSFVLADDLQFTTHGACNRMRIKTDAGAAWLTVPVLIKGRAGQLIKDVRIDNATNWRMKHWKTLRSHYGRAAYFEKYADQLERIFRREWRFLVDLNLAAFEFIHPALHMKCAWYRSSAWGITAQGTERIVEMGRRLQAGRYLTEHENAKFLQEEKFAKAGIELEFFSFTPRAYHQQYGAFTPHLSALDLLLNEGEEAREVLMKR
ncbi:WbqC family protein [candidate division KSB1 bacterium]|nr:WbqC family protein [candidate division KSB1 bacterium]